MAVRSRRTAHAAEMWPGFVDALTTLLLVIIFLLVAFVLAQHFLSLIVAGQNEALDRLSREVDALAEQLALERKTGEELRLDVEQLSLELQSSLAVRDGLSARLAEATAELEAERVTTQTQSGEIAELRASLAAERERAGALATRLGAEQDHVAAAERDIAARDQHIETLQQSLSARAAELEKEQKLSEKSRGRVDLLNRQILALRQQLAGIAKALDAAEEKAAAQKVAIAGLGKRLNTALASKVAELERYRSEFFGRLRDVLGERGDIRIQGDRFVFQSEVLFTTGSADIGARGREELTTLAGALLDIAKAVPNDLPWILRVDGHTDKAPINTAKFPSNWELSAARALSVVHFLVQQGVPAHRLASAGFGEFQPLDPDPSAQAYQRNRRIELKLTTR